MKTLIAVALAAAATIGPMTIARAETKTERVHFQAGSSEASIPGVLGSSDGVRYVLNAKNEQFLRVELRPAASYLNYIIYVPSGSVLFESSQGGLEYYGQLYQNGDHVVEVFYEGEPGTFGSYDVIFEIK